jgi:hypothetical protein
VADGKVFETSISLAEAGRLCLTRGASKIDVSLTGDRGFESVFLQRRVHCEPGFLFNGGPRILAERDHIEASRRLPEDLARELARDGFFRIFLPKAYGALDLTPRDALEIFEELAQADASVAWCVWNGNTHWTAAQLSPEAARTIHANPDVITANSTRAWGRRELS